MNNLTKKLSFFCLLFSYLVSTQNLKGDWTAKELEGLNVVGKTANWSDAKFRKSLNTEYKKLKKSYSLDSRGYLSHTDLIHLTNRLAEKFKLNSKILFQNIHPKVAFSGKEKEETRVIMSQAFGNEFLPLKIKINIPSGMTFSKKITFLKETLRNNKQAVSKFKIRPDSTIKFISNSNFKEIDDRFFFRRAIEDSPLDLKFLVIPKSFSLYVNINNFSQQKITFPLYHLNTMTIKEFKKWVAEKFKLKKSQHKKLMLMYMGQELKDEKLLSTYIREDENEEIIHAVIRP